MNIKDILVMEGDEGSMDNQGGDVIIINNNNNNNENCSDNDNAKRRKREIVEDGGSLSPLHLQRHENSVYLRHRHRNDQPDEQEEEDLRQSDDEVRVAIAAISDNLLSCYECILHICIIIYTYVSLVLPLQFISIISPSSSSLNHLLSI